jgi:hypothetical protein
LMRRSLHRERGAAALHSHTGRARGPCSPAGEHPNRDCAS